MLSLPVRSPLVVFSSLTIPVTFVDCRGAAVAAPLDQLNRDL